MNITAVLPFEVGIPLPGDPASCHKRKKILYEGSVGAVATVLWLIKANSHAQGCVPVVLLQCRVTGI
jgi:hypothetical protein